MSKLDPPRQATSSVRTRASKRKRSDDLEILQSVAGKRPSGGSESDEHAPGQKSVRSEEYVVNLKLNVVVTFECKDSKKDTEIHQELKREAQICLGASDANVVRAPSVAAEETIAMEEPCSTAKKDSPSETATTTQDIIELVSESEVALSETGDELKKIPIKAEPIDDCVNKHENGRHKLATTSSNEAGQLNHQLLPELQAVDMTLQSEKTDVSSIADSSLVASPVYRAIIGHQLVDGKVSFTVCTRKSQQSLVDASVLLAVPDYHDLIGSYLLYLDYYYDDGGQQLLAIDKRLDSYEPRSRLHPSKQRKLMKKYGVEDLPEEQYTF